MSYYAFGQNDQMYSSRGGPSADLQSGTNYNIPPPGSSSSSADESSSDESTSNEAPSGGAPSGGGAPSQGPPEGGPDGGSAALLLPLTVLAALGVGIWVWTSR